MPKYFCELCEWDGDRPKVHDPYNDGGVPVCPKGCLDKTGEPAVVYLDMKDPDVQRMLARALARTWR